MSYGELPRDVGECHVMSGECHVIHCQAKRVQCSLSAWRSFDEAVGRIHAVRIQRGLGQLYMSSRILQVRIRLSICGCRALGN
jgi:hypothetical protein